MTDSIIPRRGPALSMSKKLKPKVSANNPCLLDLIDMRRIVPRHFCGCRWEWRFGRGRWRCLKCHPITDEKSWE